MQLAAIDWGAVGALGGLLVALIASMVRVAVLASRIDQQVRTNTETINRIERHLDGLMSSTWQTIWRVASIEDFLHDELHYRVPPLVPPTINPERE